MSYDQRIADLESRIEELERPKGMQGPERHLVGQSRSDGRQGDVEEAEPGRRGVGEIGGAIKLPERIDRMKREVRVRKRSAMRSNDWLQAALWRDIEVALGHLSRHPAVNTEKRSDLSNATVEARP